MKKALISGITGQDGSYLAEHLLAKDYEVHGIIRRSSSFNRGRIDHLYIQNEKLMDKRLFLHYGDVTDTSNLNRILEKITPDEIYHLAAQSHVKVSFDVPEYTAQVDAVGTLRFLDAIRETGVKTRFYPSFFPFTEPSADVDPASERRDTVLSPQSLWCRQAVRVLDCHQLPRGLQHLRDQRHSVQS